ncbi:M28 family peptidase [Flavobacterium sp.]|uniref:M28 family peptidase n=1 Tax=Flavobacterium sp. TaxID=239 RepID=UPI00262F8FB2|nr:M28 family peptidase [Flavobacterium sp.]MDD3003658.1 M28 family peptidase [Flavobacterium sp.]
MKKNYSTLLSIFFIFGIIYWVFYAMMPQNVAKTEGSLSEFSTQRAFKKLEIITKKPHYVGSEYHSVVADYLIKELHNLGLETTLQEGYTLTDWGNLVKSKNILARIKGTANSKALLLLSHYDSAPHSKSLGASDDGSGIVTILEGLRTYLHNNSQPKNDIIILFSDAEELGLNGASLFVTQHQWAKEIGLAINFEARGTCGPSYMLMEVNNGNAEMVKHFAEAKPQFPVSNSLMYSIYKMLPNDTDLTVFREEGKIQGLNFAFIDGHYNYHTTQDNLNNLSLKTLEHQGTYLMSMLNYFGNIDLRKLETSQDDVYFNTPVNFIHYPFSWNFPLIGLAFALFIAFVFIGIGKKILHATDILRGCIPFLGSVAASGFLGFLGWKILLLIYPEYRDILHGFTYNGHEYIIAFSSLALMISFLFYKNYTTEIQVMNAVVAPLFFWILINLLIAIYLPGGSFFILPVFGMLLSFGFFIVTQRISLVLNLLFCIPALVIFVPFVVTLPVGLGLKMLMGSTLLIALVFGLLLPVLGTFTEKKFYSIVGLIIASGFFINAHFNSFYTNQHAKPNSLLYVLNEDSESAVWATYDQNIDKWTQKYIGTTPKEADVKDKLPLFSKYNSSFTYTAKADLFPLSGPSIQIQDTLVGAKKQYTITILPNRKVNRYDIFANENMDFYNFKANGASIIGWKKEKYPRNGKKILSYYVVDNIPLTLSFSTDATSKLDMELLESSFDLLESDLFSVPKRASWMIPTPFVLNDAVVIRKKIKANVFRNEIPAKTIIPKPIIDATN